MTANALTRQTDEMTAVAAFVRTWPTPGGTLRWHCHNGAAWTLEAPAGVWTRDAVPWAARVAVRHEPDGVGFGGYDHDHPDGDTLRLTWNRPVPGRADVSVHLLIPGCTRTAWWSAVVAAVWVAGRTTGGRPTADAQPDLFAGVA